MSYYQRKSKREIIEKRNKNAEYNILRYFKNSLDEANLELNMIASDDPNKTEKILQASEKAKTNS